MAPHTLLIMSCSATKNPNDGWLPARERYTGPLWQTLRASCELPENCQLAVLSARYGLISGGTMTQNYNTKMTPSIAARMIAEGPSAIWPKAPPKITQVSYGNRASCEIAIMSCYGDNPFSKIIMCGGSLYTEVMASLIADLQLNGGAIAPDAEIVKITDQIGYMRQKLKALFPLNSIQSLAA